MNRLLLCAMIIGLLPSALLADSIWDRRTYGSAYIFVDTRARRVGDLVTIAIAETTDIENKDQRDAIKSTKTGGSFNFKGSTTGVNGGRASAASVDALTTSQRALSGSSTYNVAQIFTDKITATVVQVLPNGNLVVVGMRTRVVGREIRTLQLSGVIRPIDISPTNTILSQFVGELKMTYIGQGDQSAYTNNGWMGRIMNYVWPF